MDRRIKSALKTGQHEFHLNCNTQARQSQANISKLSIQNNQIITKLKKFIFVF